MNCPDGFDPFGTRDAAFTEHARDCSQCGDVVRVLGSATRVWRTEVAKDDVRAVFRERRLMLGRARRPARTAVMSTVFFVAIGVASAWAAIRLTQGSHERALPVAEPQAPASPPVALAPSPPVPSTDRAAPPPLAPPLVSVPPLASLPSVGSATATSPLALWERGLSLLEQGDREGAGRLFHRVAEAPNAEPSLRRRAGFRWAEIRLAKDDTTSCRPRSSQAGDVLWDLVRGPDTPLGFDAALLLERCVPELHDAVWDAFLATAPAEPFDRQALARKTATTPSR